MAVHARQGSAQILFKVGKGPFCRGAPADDHIVEAGNSYRLEIKVCQRTQASPNPVPDNGIPDFPGRREADPRIAAILPRTRLQNKPRHRR